MRARASPQRFEWALSRRGLLAGYYDPQGTVNFWLSTYETSYAFLLFDL
jgi:hypothetical protein